MENPITNTLFRFVSLRSPKLLEENLLNRKFIYHTQLSSTNIFYNTVLTRPTGSPKWQALTSAPYTPEFSSVHQIKTALPDLYEFSLWLIRNRSTYTQPELLAQAALVSSTPPIENIWNDFYYQVITQESFYLKEALMQLLLAIHVLDNLSSSNDLNDLDDYLVNATIVLSAELFDDRINGSGSISARNITLEDEYVLKSANSINESILSAASAEIEIRALESLQKTIEKIEKKYQRELKKRFNEEYSRFQSQSKNNDFKNRLDIDLATQEFCSNNTIENSNDPCKQIPQVSYKPVVFDFNTDTEVSAQSLKLQLSDHAWTTLLGILGFQFDENSNVESPKMVAWVESALAHITSYSALNKVLTNRKQNLELELLHSNSDQANFISIGGIITQIQDSVDLPPFNFELCNNYFHATIVFNLQIGIPDESWQIELISATTLVVGQPPVYTLLIPIASTNGSVLNMPGFFNYTYPNGTLSSNTQFAFEITFTNGCKKTINSYGPVRRTCIKGVASGTCSTVVVPSSTPVPFVPSGFGILNIGTADYKRVDQTIQCYVEGEVSNIENVMAREYREKSTRLLRRSDETTTTSSEAESEILRDTTSTDRFEMQSEVSQIIQESQSLSGHLNVRADLGKVLLDTGLTYANSTSTENSTNQAITIAKDITDRAMERVISKVKEERIIKIIEEFEENNMHGYDNRKGNKHISGVYRWVDKLYRNQILNYGSRTMFEFMIPEPSRLHRLWLKEQVDDNAININPPIDPRNSTLSLNLRLIDASFVTQSNAAHWASVFKVEIVPMPEQSITVGESFAIDLIPHAKKRRVEARSGNGKVKIPAGYKAKKAKGSFTAISDNEYAGGALLSLSVANRIVYNEHAFRTMSIYFFNFSGGASTFTYWADIDSNLVGEVPVSFTLGNHLSGDVSVSIMCELTIEALNNWKQETFNAIITAYESAALEYSGQLEAEKEKANINKNTNPGFYREFENMVLRKNCISYLISQNDTDPLTFGNTNLSSGQEFKNYKIEVNESLNHYGEFIKFLEQAFEWNIMSYGFYPYYWGNRNRWSELYGFNETDDPTFRKFMEAGMARVIVPVRPGFEKAVNLYMGTGIIWNGGQIPVLDDPLFISLIDEIRPTTSTPEGKPWITRVPTSLTILQAGTIGLQVEQALPCNCENLEEFESPSVIPCNENFVPTESLIGGESGPDITRFEAEINNIKTT